MAKSSRKLARPMTVAGVTYDAGHEVDDELAKEIRNPKAYVPLENAESDDDAPDPTAGTESGHKLAKTVTVGGISYGPNDPIPDDVAREIRNPKAWKGGKLPDLNAKAAEVDEPEGSGQETEGSEQEPDGSEQEPNGSEPDQNAEAETSTDEGQAAGSKPARGSRSRAR